MELKTSTDKNGNIPTLVVSLEKERSELDNQLLLSQQLLQENEELQSEVISLNIKKVHLQTQVEELRKKVESSQKNISALEQEVAQIETENQRFNKEYVEAAKQIGRLASLYTASYRLHQTLNKQEVLQIISEILSDILGISQFGIFETGIDGSSLLLIHSSGIDASAYSSISAGVGLIGQVITSKKSFLIGQHPDDNRKLPQETNLTACITLKLEGKVLGVIAIFQTPSKEFSPTEKELFELLSSHVATALHCSGLHS